MTCLAICLLVASSLSAANVIITPLGSHLGEYCVNDRALLFEDPTGVRILWDPGRAVAGDSDPRLGAVHVLLLSSVHQDHVGDVMKNAAAPGTCAAPATISAAPNSNAGAIAAAKNSVIIAGGEMASFLGRKVQNIRGTATAQCPAAGLTNEVVVPRSEPCFATTRPGGSRTVRMTNASAGVKIASVPAFHSNGIPATLVDTPGVAAGTTGYGGNDNGAIIQFTNGLVVYLTADTGPFGDMDTIVRRYYHPDVAVINIPDTAAMGPDEGAFAIRELIKPLTVIPEHASEAATSGGAVLPGTRTERFIQQLRSVRAKVNVIVPLSDMRIECDGSGRCR